MTATDARERILQAAYGLVFERGFNATTVDAILEATGASKGAFFHHFPSKGALARALLEHYARIDAEVLDNYMSQAEARTDDPRRQLLEFVRGIEVAVEEGVIDQPGCLFASYVYEQIPEECGSDAIILGAIKLWRDRIVAKLEEGAAARPFAIDVDLDSLADHVWAVFEGAFVLTRATGDRMQLRDQLAHLRAYLSLLFDLPADATR